ncbi:hypothetical protein ACROYT_G039721 [Oculina patagonica]
MSAKSFLSTVAIHYFGFTMAVDYSIVLLSVQELWDSLGGSAAYYGFMFGSYALAQAIVSPLLGYISDLRGLKFAVMLSLIVNITGNVLYGLSVLSQSLNMAFIGRFVAGLSAGSVTLALIYLTNTTPRETRGKSVASFKLAQAVGLLGGPIIGMFLVPPLAGNIHQNVTSAKVFNMYTTPAWLATANVVVIMLPLIKYCFKNPMAPHMAMKFNYREAKGLIAHTIVLMLLMFFGTACFWGITSDLFTLAFGQYRLVSAQRDLWKVYISGGIAFVFAGVLIRGTIHRKLSPAMFSILGLILNVWGFVMLLDYKITDERLRNGFYFGAVALAISGGAAFFTGVGVYYLQKITDFSDQARNRRGLFLGFFNFAEALGRFAGPALISLFLRLTNKDDKGSPGCNPVEFDATYCKVSNVNIVLATLCGVLFVNLLLFIYYHIVHGKRRTDGFLLTNTDLPNALEGRLTFREDLDDFADGDREVSGPVHTQMELSPPQVHRTSSHASSSLDGSIHTV